MPNFDSKHEEKLFAAYATNTLIPEERDELAAYLETHSSAQGRLVAFIQDTGLFLEVGGELEMLQRSKATFTVGELLMPQPKEKAAPKMAILYAVAAILIATLGTVLFMRGQTATIDHQPPIARIDATPAIDDNSDFVQGNWLNAGPIELASGQLDLTLETGVEVSIAGPANANLLSKQRVSLTTGLLSAYTPPEAAGFTVSTPYGNVVDLGTAFIVDANSPDQITIHVTEGIVEFWPTNKNLPTQRIAANQAFVATMDSIRPITPPRSIMLEHGASGPVHHPIRYQHWSFNNKESNLLPNTGPRSASQFPLIMEKGHRPDKIEGPFGPALSFNGIDDHLSSEHPGILGPNPRTIAFWMQIPPNASKADSHAIIAWGKPAGRQNEGEKWQIAWNPNRNDGTIGAIRTEAGLGYIIGTTDLRDGRWHHIAIVLIGGDAPNVSTHVRQYVDGQLEGVSGTQARYVNTASGFDNNSNMITLGRYLDSKSRHARMNLDEVYVIEAALVPHEIQHLINTNSLKQAQEQEDPQPAP